MTGKLSIGRLRADDAKCELSRSVFEANRPGVEPDDAKRALIAAMLRAIAKLEEAERTLGEGIVEASTLYGQLRQLEVENEVLRGGTEAADRLIDSRPPLIATFTRDLDRPVPTDGDDLDDRAEMAGLGPDTVQLRTAQPTDAQIDAMALEGAAEDAYAGLVDFTRETAGKGVGA